MAKPIEVFLESLTAKIVDDQQFGGYTVLDMPPPESQVTARTVYVDMEGIGPADGIASGGASTRMLARFAVTTVFSLSQSIEHARQVRKARLRMVELVNRHAHAFMQAEAQPADFTHPGGALVTVFPEEPVTDDTMRYAIITGEVMWDEPLDGV